MSLIVLVVKVPTWRLIASYSILDPFPPRNPEIISHQLTCGLSGSAHADLDKVGLSWNILTLFHKVPSPELDEHLRTGRTVYLMASGQAIQCLHISHRK